MKKKLIVSGFVILNALLFIAAIMFFFGGHGSYTFLNIVSPYLVFLIRSQLVSSMYEYIFVGVLQISIYSYVFSLWVGNVKNKVGVNVIGVHLFLAICAFFTG